MLRVYFPVKDKIAVFPEIQQGSTDLSNKPVVTFVYSAKPGDTVMNLFEMIARHATEYEVKICDKASEAEGNILLVTDVESSTRESFDSEIQFCQKNNKPFLVLHRQDNGQPTPGDYPSVVWTEAGYKKVDKAYHAQLVRMPLFKPIFPKHSGSMLVGTFGHTEPKKKTKEIYQHLTKIGVPCTVFGTEMSKKTYASYYEELRLLGCYPAVFPWYPNLEQCTWLSSCSHFIFYLPASKEGTGGGSLTPRKATLFNRPIIIVDDEDTYKPDRYNIFRTIEEITKSDIENATLPDFSYTSDRYLDSLVSVCTWHPVAAEIIPPKINLDGTVNFTNLYQRIVDEAPPRSKLVELGTWLGKSAVYMAERIKQTEKDLTFCTIDNFEGSKGDAEEIRISQNNAVLLEAANHIKNSGVKDNINMIVADSVKAANLFSDCSLFFVFLDSCHLYDHVLDELKAWYPKVRPGGYMGGHDFGRPDVSRAVNEFFLSGIEAVQPDAWLKKV